MHCDEVALIVDRVLNLDLQERSQNFEASEPDTLMPTIPTLRVRLALKTGIETLLNGVTQMREVRTLPMNVISKLAGFCYGVQFLAAHFARFSARDASNLSISSCVHGRLSIRISGAGRAGFSGAWVLVVGVFIGVQFLPNFTTGSIRGTETYFW